MKRLSSLAILAVWLLAAPAAWPAPSDADDDQQPNEASASIITKYVEATQTHEDELRGASMQVDINASVPKLKEHGTLKALRHISKVGQITYRFLGFQGDNTVKTQVIARYLEAEQQGQGDQSLAIIPANYKFKFKGRKPGEDGHNVYVFQLSPRHKKVGLFKGEIWLDCKTYLPLYEKGRLVKNPSVFFKKVDFDRKFAIHDGKAIPEQMRSTIDARFIGTVQIDIDYSNFEQSPVTDTAADTANEAALSAKQ